MGAFDPIGGLSPGPGNLELSTLLRTTERHFWLELWRALGVLAVEEQGFETRFYGPVHAHAIAACPRTPLLNVVLGAAEPGAVERGQLGAALEWTESLGLECRIPVPPGLAGSSAAEDLLNRRGYRRTASLVWFARGATAPGFPEPPGIEVDEWDGWEEGFSSYFDEGFELGFPEDHVFDCLLGRDPWRCYVAVDEREEGAGAAIMLKHYGVAHLVLSTTRESARGRGVHMALLRRRMLDAAASRAELLLAQVEEPLDDPDPPTRATRNLLRAGFKQVAAHPVWCPPT